MKDMSEMIVGPVPQVHGASVCSKMVKQGLWEQPTKGEFVMKKRQISQLGYLLCLLLCVSAVGCAGCAGTSTARRGAGHAEVERVVQAFSDGIASREVAKVASVLHRDSQQYAWFKKSLMKIPQSVYLGLLKSGKIGGVRRALKIHQVDVTGNLAAAKISLSDDKVRLEYYLNLMKLEGRWQIMANVMRLVPKG